MYTKTLIPAINTFFDDFLTQDFANVATSKFNNPYVQPFPAVNIKETDSNYGLELAAPGLEKNNFNVELKKNILTISYRTEQESEEKKEHYVRKEYNFSAFKRSFTIPEDKFDASSINASYTNGILHVSIAKIAKEEHKISQVIEVK